MENKINSIFDIEAIIAEFKILEEFLERLKNLKSEIGFEALERGKSLFSHQLEIHSGWSDEDMLNFANIVFFRSPGEAKKLLEDYRNRPRK